MTPTKPHSLWILTSPVGRAIAAASALLLIGTGIWWAATDPAPDDTITIPSKVCNNYISGQAVAPLLPTTGKKFEERAPSFRVTRMVGHCTLKAGGERVSISITLFRRMEYPRWRVEAEGIPISLGKAYGYLSDTHAMHLHVPCVVVAKTQRLVVKVSSSMTNQEKAASKKGTKPAKTDLKLATLSANVSRELARNWFRCPYADELPAGPTKIHWNR
ncbi:hypothetical protein [Streptomyces zagrosensis]|uniref:Uncharacterized protein n=1 Tax=Streptomyces zagrosensis TaxID=1042984 RepID=A0A7W9Q6U6_9ACTN|nr:hypothetical protein [Streptomyces zagrosensis]MBB5934630.1 hypothetical protein [Streptomyces zagrosensis]